jgi:uncharacterized protein YqgC (DUF456 family)
MDVFLIITAGLLMIAGIAGCFLPALPGPPLAYGGLILAHLSGFARFEKTTLAVLGVLTALTLVLDYVVPAWGARRFGGSRYGVWGAIIGLIIGVFFIPLGPLGLIGMIGGAFLGAFAGELLAGGKSGPALRAAFGSLAGFAAGTFIKIALSLTMAGIFLARII